MLGVRVRKRGFVHAQQSVINALSPGYFVDEFMLLIQQKRCILSRVPDEDKGWQDDSITEGSRGITPWHSYRHA